MSFWSFSKFHRSFFFSPFLYLLFTVHDVIVSHPLFIIALCVPPSGPLVGLLEGVVAPGLGGVRAEIYTCPAPMNPVNTV
jgi:hypothetical protein